MRDVVQSMGYFVTESACEDLGRERRSLLHLNLRAYEPVPVAVAFLFMLLVRRDPCA